MKLQELLIEPSVLGIGESGTVRAAGIHASDIYNDYFKKFDPRRYGKFKSAKPDPLLCEPGLIFENMLEEGLKRRLAESHEDISRPGEFTWDGEWKGRPVCIHYTPDLVIFNGEFRIGEIKATWMSSGLTQAQVDSAIAGDYQAQAEVRDALLDPKFDKYLTQIKLYCYFQRTRFARLYAFFINANYKPPFPPQLLAWDIEFSQDELDFNAGLMLNHASSIELF